MGPWQMQEGPWNVEGNYNQVLLFPHCRAEEATPAVAVHRRGDYATCVDADEDRSNSGLQRGPPDGG